MFEDIDFGSQDCVRGQDILLRHHTEPIVSVRTTRDICDASIPTPPAAEAVAVVATIYLRARRGIDRDLALPLYFQPLPRSTTRARFMCAELFLYSLQPATDRRIGGGGPFASLKSSAGRQRCRIPTAQAIAQKIQFFCSAATSPP